MNFKKLAILVIRKELTLRPGKFDEVWAPISNFCYTVRGVDIEEFFNNDPEGLLIWDGGDGLATEIQSLADNFDSFRQNLSTAAKKNSGENNAYTDIALLDLLLTKDEYSGGEQEINFASGFMRMYYDSLAGNATYRLYSNLVGSFNVTSSTTRYLASGFEDLFVTVLRGIVGMRFLNGEGVGNAVEKIDTIASIAYRLKLEELEQLDNEYIKTFSDCFQEYLYDSTSKNERCYIISNGKVTIKATLQNEGADKNLLYKNGGPVQYYRLGSLVII